jgi:hypothetical protein
MSAPQFTPKELDRLLAGLTIGDVDELIGIGLAFDPASRSFTATPDAIEIGKEVLWRKCRDDETFFLLESGLVKTEDHEERWLCRECGRVFEAHKPKSCVGPEWDPGCGSSHVRRRSPFQPFPSETHEYLYDVMWALENKRRVALPKSRRMLISEIVSGHALHGAMWHRAFSGAFQTHREDAADGNIQRVYGQYSRLPGWMKARRPANPQKSGESLQLAFHIPSNRASIIGLAQGSEQIRSYGPTLYWMDECGSIPEVSETYGAVEPTMKEGTQMILTGTAGTANAV